MNFVYFCTNKITYLSKTNKMKLFLKLLFLLSLPLSIHAQIIFEKAYPTTDLHRVYWTYGGEKYWFSNDSLREIKIYSADHQLIRTIPYPSVPNTQVRLLQSEHGLTQTTLNNDDLMEMVWIFKDTLTKQEKLQIRNENNEVLFTLNSRPHIISFNEIEGLRTKLFITIYDNGTDIYSTRVYDLPNMNLENVYFRSYYLHRKKFGYAGETYFYKDSKARAIHVYNKDHIYRTSVDLAWFPAARIDDSDTYTDADDNLFSKDSLVEVTFTYASNESYSQMIRSENGQIIYKTGYGFRIDHQKGLEDRFFAQEDYINEHHYGVHVLPSLGALKLSQLPIFRTVLKKYGETYFTKNTENNIVLHTQTTNNIKIIRLPISNSIFYPHGLMQDTGFPIITDSIINPDTLIEVIYSEYQNRNNVRKYTTKIINDTGFVYKTIEDTRYFSINQTKGLSDKLFTKTGNDKPYETKIWRFGNTTATKSPPSVSDVLIYPNPFSSEVTVDIGTIHPSETVIKVYDALGKQIYFSQIFESKTQISLNNFGKGIYFFDIMNSKGRVIRKVIKLND